MQVEGWKNHQLVNLRSQVLPSLRWSIGYTEVHRQAGKLHRTAVSQELLLKCLWAWWEPCLPAFTGQWPLPRFCPQMLSIFISGQHGRMVSGEHSSSLTDWKHYKQPCLGNPWTYWEAIEISARIWRYQGSKPIPFLFTSSNEFDNILGAVAG